MLARALLFCSAVVIGTANNADNGASSDYRRYSVVRFKSKLPDTVTTIEALQKLFPCPDPQQPQQQQGALFEDIPLCGGAVVLDADRMTNEIDLLLPPPSPPNNSWIDSPMFSRMVVSWSFTVLVHDVQEAIDAEQHAYQSSSFKNGNMTAGAFFDSFKPYEEIEKFVDDLVAKYPNLLETVSIGATVEARRIKGVILRGRPGGSKPGLYMEATQHAREWLAPTTLLWVLNEMVTRYGTDEEITGIVDSIDMMFIPVLNIDGYTFSWASSNNRLWRKNRRLNSDRSYGVDLNRNWGPSYTWCSSGSSTLPTSDTYCGTGPFSEPETIAASEAAFELFAGRTKTAAVDFHTYGSLLLWPWQYTYDRLPSNDYSMFSTLGRSIQDAMNAINDRATKYVSQQGSALYPHSGGMVDYLWTVSNTLAFTIEGPGTSFTAPVSLITPAGKEGLAAVLLLAERLLEE